MAVIRLFLYGLLVLLVGGCGQTVTETLHIPTGAPTQPACNETIVVLPFADYSYADNVASAHSRNLTIMEALSDRLVAKGFLLPVQEDVFQYLVGDEIISLMPYKQGQTASFSNSVAAEIDNGGWSDMMQQELLGVMDKTSNDDPQLAPGTHGLTRKTVQALGKEFRAGYLIRGRIIEYRLGKEHTWDPTKRGMLPFVYGTASKTLFGIASSDSYDNINAMALGGIAGALAGHNATAPFVPLDEMITVGLTSTTTTSTGTEDFASMNSLAWGVAGAAVGHLAQKGGDTPQAVVQLRLWAQDTGTGEVIWTNRADVKVSPESVFGDSRSESLFHTAVERAVSSLVDDFWSKAKARL